ncbi:hypothetical protein F511_05114 [Dorcoceras hygrometricum]|uniref:Uncharacterized protein n=1 Tax=Dorcoceras hygrometricum TaxID=472368 RepID=A0A2Z7AMP1_9LAMI|nr:hypothetical protein F511_05114 [Dorcoceras hygrometricum]
MVKHTTKVAPNETNEVKPQYEEQHTKAIRYTCNISCHVMRYGCQQSSVIKEHRPTSAINISINHRNPDSATYAGNHNSVKALDSQGTTTQPANPNLGIQ